MTPRAAVVTFAGALLALTTAATAQRALEYMSPAME